MSTTITKRNVTDANRKHIDKVIKGYVSKQFEKTGTKQSYRLRLIDSELTDYNNSPDSGIDCIELQNSHVKQLTLYGKRSYLTLNNSKIDVLKLMMTETIASIEPNSSFGYKGIPNGFQSSIDFIYTHPDFPLLRLYTYADKFSISHHDLTAAAHRSSSIFRHKLDLIIAGARNAKL